MALHTAGRDEVSVIFLTSGELGLKQLAREEAWKIREAEARAAAKVLGLASSDFLRGPDWMIGDDPSGMAAKFSPVLKQLTPELIYLPHPNEWHPDHRASLPIVRLALKAAGIANPKLRGYEIWTPLTEYQHVENITAVMPRKLRAVRKHASQLKEWDYVRAIRALNEYRGAMAGRCRYAEVFQELSPDA